MALNPKISVTVSSIRREPSQTKNKIKNKTRARDLGGIYSVLDGWGLGSAICLILVFGWHDSGHLTNGPSYTRSQLGRSRLRLRSGPVIDRYMYGYCSYLNAIINHYTDIR
jgi:hypothetical protein